MPEFLIRKIPFGLVMACGARVHDSVRGLAAAADIRDRLR